jgi:hypothetical protein
MDSDEIGVILRRLIDQGWAIGSATLTEGSDPPRWCAEIATKRTRIGGWGITELEAWRDVESQAMAIEAGL